MSFLILNGPNIQSIGNRKPDTYGHDNIIDHLNKLNRQDVQIVFENSEAGLIKILHSLKKEVKGVVLNAGAYTHTSLALADAVESIKVPVVEVHVSNIYKREFYRKTSYISENCIGSISGFGLNSYNLAIQALESVT